MEDPVDFGCWKISCVCQKIDFADGVQKTEFGTQSILSLLLWVNCVSLLPYAYADGQHINELKHCVYV